MTKYEHDQRQAQLDHESATSRTAALSLFLDDDDSAESTPEPIVHSITIESDQRGVQVGNTEHHIYHRWRCTCGLAGPWGHALWAVLSVKSALTSGQRHVEHSTYDAEELP